MNDKPQYSNLIYEYFYMRFRFGYYKCGDTLPTIDTLCREFGVSAQTVKTALKHLRAEGYIDMHNGRATKVLFQQSTQELCDFALNFFSQRKHAFSDLNRSVELISLPLLVEGFRRTDEDELAQLSRYIERAHTDDLIYFFCYIEQKLENSLAMNLFWETSLFLGLLFIGDKGGDSIHNEDNIRKGLSDVISCRKIKDWSWLQAALVKYQKDSVEQALRHISQHIEPAEKQLQIPFTWRIYRERPQLCYDLVIRILHEIYLGEYREAEYLPSYEKMATEYGVSLSTVRRTIRMLNHLGITHSINGIGTRIFAPGEHCNRPDFTDPAIRRGFVLFFQALEMTIFTCRGVIRCILLSSTQEQKNVLISQLEECLHTDSCVSTLWHLLLYCCENSPLQGVREVYIKLYGLFLWGNSLQSCLEKISDFKKASYEFTEALLVCLHKNDYDGCGIVVQRQLEQQLPAAERLLLKNGFRSEELRMSTSIRLILTNGEKERY